MNERFSSTPNSIQAHTGAQALNSLDGLNELYQEVIMEHAKNPRCKGKPACCHCCQDGKNPLCGDSITVYCSIEQSSDQELPRISIHFDGSGCSISQASASIMCEKLQHVTVNEARKTIARAEEIYTGKQNFPEFHELDDDLEALAGIRKFPVRVKCAALAWKSLNLLLDEYFDAEGKVKTQPQACTSTACAQESKRRLKIVSTEAQEI